MSNQKSLEKYLIGEDGYLKKDISNGKVIMLSGKWGSGKTFFWKEIIEKNLKKEKIPNNYISLYGKTSIQEIKNEVFLKIFESMDIFKIDDKSFGLAKDTANLITDITKSVSVFGFNLDLSNIVDKSFEKLEKVKEEKKEKDIKNTFNSGAIICFDDFERKSKDIDLNDLFGFITNLTIEFDCKVVIILNDDVFEGEEKKIFSNVKEKSVSKFLKYEPSIRDLFKSIIFQKNNEGKFKYSELKKYLKIILKTIEETQELNARIYIQVLDNLVEWIENKQETNDDILRCLILVNINFVLYHNIPSRRKTGIYINEIPEYKYEFDELLSKGFIFENLYNKDNINSFKKYIQKLEKDIYDIKDSFTEVKIKHIKDNELLFKSTYFSNKYDLSMNIKEHDKTFQKINNFIETGILINE